MNKTHIDSISNNPTVFWTASLRFIALGETAEEMWYIKSTPVAEVTVHELPEHMTLASILNATYLIKQSVASGEESFRIWITEKRNKEDGGKYQWDSAQVALKKVAKIKRGGDEESKEMKRESVHELEDGELPDEMEIDAEPA